MRIISASRRARRGTLTHGHARPACLRAFVSDAPAEFKTPLRPLKAAFVLTDPADPRHQAHARFRERLGKFVLEAARYLRDEARDDSTDAVTGIIGMLSTYRASLLHEA